MLRTIWLALVVSVIPNTASGSCDLTDPYAALSCQIGAPDETHSEVLAPLARAQKYVLRASAISSTDLIEPFTDLHPRFSKVPAHLVPIYEHVAEEYDVPVKYLVADGSYETHFNPRAIGDHGASCGLHQFRDPARSWTAWGFKNLEECLTPANNIGKMGENMRKFLNRGWPMEKVIRYHNGANSYAYSAVVMAGADRYYE